MTRRLRLQLHTEELTPDVDDILRRMPEPQRKRLARLQEALEKRYAAKGHQDGAQRASADIDALLRAALLDFSDTYLVGKQKTIRRLVALQEEVMGVYDQVLGSARKKADVDLPGLRAKYQEMSQLFDELRVTPKQALGKAGKKNVQAAVETIKITPTPLKPHQPATLASAQDKMNKLARKPTWEIKGEVAIFRHATAKTVARIGSDGKIEVTVTLPGKDSVTIREHQVWPRHGSQPTPHGNVLQSHHGSQNALIDDLIGPNGKYGDMGYRGDDWPTIWLRDRDADSPHGRISGLQIGRKGQAEFANIGAIRSAGAQDLRAAEVDIDVIREYLRKFDEKFNAEIRPKIEKRFPDPARQKQIIGKFEDI